MAHEQLFLIIGLLFMMTLLYMLSQRLNVPYPVFLVIAGLCIGFVPEIPQVKLDPNLVFTIFLPPILYEAAWNTIWSDFWKLRRPISLMAFGLVLFTSVIVAYTSSLIIPGFTLAAGFLLGGIISPPDAVSATSILKNVNIPKNATVILEGESLINDASSLIVMRFALLAVISGQFSLATAISDFFIVVIMGIVTGIIIAHIYYFIHRFLPTTPSVDTVLTLTAPYVMYITSEHFHYSGVLAVVCGGLFLSFRSQDFISSVSRLQAGVIWETLIFLLNGVIFILIGLQLPIIMKELGEYSIHDALKYSLIISAIIIIVRILWVYPATFLPRIFNRKLRNTDIMVTSNVVFVVGWAGMRGVLSLASALSIPLVLSDNVTLFPFRNLILFITFIVILVTLVAQGLTLPFIVRFLKVDRMNTNDSEKDQETSLSLYMDKVSLNYLQSKYSTQVENNDRLNYYKTALEHQIAKLEYGKQEGKTKSIDENNEYITISRDIISQKRTELKNLRKKKAYGGSILHNYEKSLDIEEAGLKNK